MDVECEEERAAAIAELSMQIAEDSANESFSNPLEFKEAVTPSHVARNRGERYFRRCMKEEPQRMINSQRL